MRRPRLFRLLAAVFLALALAAFPAPSARAAAIGVTTIADELNADGDCSLREAIRATNLNAPVDACPAGTGADTIDLPAGVYTLAIAGSNEDAALSGDLDITESLTITGALSTTTVIDGGALDNVLDIISGTATISGLTVRNGINGLQNRSGAALAILDSTVSDNRYIGVTNSGALTITQSLIADNVGTGVYSLGKALISGSMIQHNNNLNPSNISFGGGIANGGPMLVTNSSVISNTAAVGGGINTSGLLMLKDSLVSDNLATSDSGLSELGVGGGIFNAGGPGFELIVENSSIVHNRAAHGGGGIHNFWLAHISNSTIADNTVTGSSNLYFDGGGGIENDNNGIMTIAGSLLYNNTSNASGGGITAFGSVSIDRASIISNTARVAGGGISSGDYVTITQSLISNNTSNASGGGITAFGSVSIDRTSIISNTAGLYGGGMISGIYVTITQSLFSNNHATQGGGISNFGLLDIISSAIISNTATEDGGGIYNVTVHGVRMALRRDP